MTLLYYMKASVGPFIWLLALLVIFEISQGTVTVFWVNIYPTYDSETSGVVIMSDFESRPLGAPDKYNITYSYSVNEEVYLSKVVGGYDFSQNVGETLKKYQRDDAVKVFYDSSNPSYSKLEDSELSVFLGLKIIIIFSIFIFHLMSNIYSVLRNR